MNEIEMQQTGYRLKKALDQSTENLPSEILNALRTRRSLALDAARHLQNGRDQSRISQVIALIGNPLRNLAMVTALGVGLVGTYYIDQLDMAMENEEIDSALLSDDLPPEIYTDSGFHVWLERSNSSSSE
jgi:Protein of unknown function (DUF3619)